MPSITIPVTVSLEQWVRRRVESGDYSDAGDYVRDLIRRDQALEAESP